MKQQQQKKKKRSVILMKHIEKQNIERRPLSFFVSTESILFNRKQVLLQFKKENKFYWILQA